MNTYDRWHRELARRESDEGRSDAIWHRMVKRRLGDVRGLKIAEIGCGRGDFAIDLARMGAHVTAMDFSAEAIDVARGRASGSDVAVEFLVGDAQATGLPDAAFDLVVSCECMEHVVSPQRMAVELYRLCKPGGRCIVTTPSLLNGLLIARMHSFITRKPLNTGAGVQPHENFFIYFLVKRMFRHAGFKIVDFESRVFQFLLLPRVDPARLRVVQFRSSLLNRLFRPIGVHFLYDMRKGVEAAAQSR